MRHIPHLFAQRNAKLVRSRAACTDSSFTGQVRYRTSAVTFLYRFFFNFFFVFFCVFGLSFSHPIYIYL